MEPLAYVELAFTYEESGGNLDLPPLSPPSSVPLKKVWSWGAIAVLIFLGGFGAALSTAFSDSTPVPAIEQQVP